MAARRPRRASSTRARARPRQGRQRRPQRRRRWRRWLLIAVLLPVLGPLLLAGLYRFVPPPATPLMLVRAIQGHGIEQEWVRLDAVSPHVIAAVIASEDNLFCSHEGFDWTAMRQAFDAYERGGRLRGASTISMQTAKNLFLWPGRSWLRKALEAYFTLYLETLWPKARILEVYLNIAEWGDGIYGIGAAARHHFGRPASLLSRHEAALLAVVLPNPLEWSPAAPTDYIRRRASIIESRMAQIESLLDCVRDR